MRLRAVSGLLLVGVFAGCTRLEPRRAFDDVRSSVAERTNVRLEWRGVTAEDRAVDQAVQRMLQSELTIDQAVQIALLNNRQLQATYEELGVAQAQLVQAGLLSNPVFEFGPRWPTKSGFEFGYELTVVQDFLDVLLRPLRKRVAAAQFQARKLRVADAVLDTAAEVKVKFSQLQGAQQLVEMRQTALDATEASAEAASRLREAGNITELELTSHLALHEQTKLDLRRAEVEVEELRAELEALLGLSGSDTRLQVAIRLPELPPDNVEPRGLESLAIQQRLDLAAAREELRLLSREVKLTRASRFPLSVGVHVEAESDPDGPVTVGPHLETQIPLFDRGQARIAIAQARLRQGRQRYAALETEIRAQVRRLRARLMAERTRVEHYRSGILPLRRRAVEQAQLQYNAMQFGVFQLLSAKQAEIDAGRDYIESLRDYWLARAELERAVGGSLPLAPSAAATTQAAPATQPATMPAAEPPHHHHHH